MSGAALKLGKRYGWTDYCGWSDDERWEIIGGEAFDMSPAPTFRHQALVGELYWQFSSEFRGKKCKVFVAPADVKLSEEDIVQPDIFVVCDLEKIRVAHLEGAPTLVVEVLSPATAKKDRTLKMDLYASSGVKEYWIVDPDNSGVEVFGLDGRKYKLAGRYKAGDKAESVVFAELGIDLKVLFENSEIGAGSGELRRVKEEGSGYE